MHTAAHKVVGATGSGKGYSPLQSVQWQHADTILGGGLHCRDKSQADLGLPVNYVSVVAQFAAPDFIVR